MPFFLIKPFLITAAPHGLYHLVWKHSDLHLLLPVLTPAKYLQLTATVMTSPNQLSPYLHILFLYISMPFWINVTINIHKFNLHSSKHTSFQLAELKSQHSFLWVERWGMKKREGERWRDDKHLWFNIVSCYPCHTHIYI